MARKPNANDTAAQMRKTSADLKKIADGPLAIGDQPETTPTPTELARDYPEIFGAEKASGGDSLKDRKTPLSRQPAGGLITADQRHAMENDGKPLNEPAKTEGQQIELGDRVMLHTRSPVNGATVNAAFVIGFSPVNGRPALRLEDLGGTGRPVEFGGVFQNQGENEVDPYWTWPEDSAKVAEAEEKASTADEEQAKE